MKLLVETLEEIPSGGGSSLYKVNPLLSEEIKTKNVTSAKDRASQLKNADPSKKIRVIEYRNDEPDETRQACVIVFEAA